MTSLEKLPTEILLRIASLLSKKDLAAISLQCSHLHAIADMAPRRRYRRIRVGGASWPRAYNLLWKILRKPILGALVKDISCDPLSFDYGDMWFPRPDENEAPLLRSAITGAGFTGKKAEDLSEILMFDRQRL